MPDKLGRSAMFYAVLYNQEEILEYFIEKQANCNVMLVDFFNDERKMYCIYIRYIYKIIYTL
jgi:ankyrin repeat protein